MYRLSGSGATCSLPLLHSRYVIQINPGEVKVLVGKTQKMIYSDGTGSDNPYEKMRIKIVPTRLAVKVRLERALPLIGTLTMLGLAD